MSCCLIRPATQVFLVDMESCYPGSATGLESKKEVIKYEWDKTRERDR